MNMEVTPDAPETFGQRLKKQREEKGLTLEEIANKTRIPVRNLKALETGDEAHLPASVYIKGFLRAYARELGLDEHKLVDEYNSIFGFETDKFKMRVPVTPKQNSYKLPVFVIALFLVAILVVGGYYFFKSPGESVLQTPPPPVTDKKAVEAEKQAESIPAVPPETSKPVEATGQATEPPRPEQTLPAPEGSISTTNQKAQPEASKETKIAGATPASHLLHQELPPAPEAGPHTLKINALQETWLQIFIDDQEGRQYLLKPGQSVSWQAKKYFKLKIGNAGGVKLVFDNEALPPLGEPGEVKELRLPKNRQ